MNFSKIVWILIGIIAVAMVGVFSFMLSTRQDVQKQTDQNTQVETEQPVANGAAEANEESITGTQTTTVAKDWGKEWGKYLPNTNFLEAKDITGDGAPEVLVNSFVAQGGSGTPVSKVLVFTIKDNKAVEIPVYKNGVVYELSQYSGNVQAARILFISDGVEERQLRSKGLNPGAYEILDSKIVFTYNKNTNRLETGNAAATILESIPPTPIGSDTLSQFKNITSWTVTEDFVMWKNYYTFSQKMDDVLRTYPDGQMITMAKGFNLNSVERKNVIDAVFLSLAQNNWKRIADSYATDLIRFDQYLYVKNSKPLVLTIEKTQFENEQVGIQIQFLK